jgi:hypothetical protein
MMALVTQPHEDWVTVPTTYSDNQVPVDFRGSLSGHWHRQPGDAEPPLLPSRRGQVHASVRVSESLEGCQWHHRVQRRHRSDAEEVTGVY